MLLLSKDYQGRNQQAFKEHRKKNDNTTIDK